MAKKTKTKKSFDRGQEFFSTFPSPLRYCTMFYLFRFLGFLFVYGRLLPVLFQRNAATATVFLFFCHYNHLLSD